jgi:hypothetical protein
MENLNMADLERRLRQHVSVLCEEIGPRSIYTFENLSRAERYISQVMLTETAFLRNPHYHTWRDTPDRLDFEAMAQVTKSVLLFLADRAENS